MSDDEYYDEFDDDIFWIEEPEPDAAVSQPTPITITGSTTKNQQD